MSTPNANFEAVNWTLIKRLVIKDWQLFEKPMAAFVLGGLVALCLMGAAKPWSFYLGSFLLIIIIVAVACFSVSSSVINERKEKTLAFSMSMPISPFEYYVYKLLANLLTCAVPLGILASATIALVYLTPLPNGLIVYSLLIFGHVALAFCVSLCVALAVESEGLNIFAMISSMVMINPFIMILGQIPAINDAVKVDAVTLSWQALTILATQAVASILILAATGWHHCRKRAFY